MVAKPTGPVGVVGDDEVSVIVAVQVLAVPTVSELGAQLTVAIVVCRGAVLVIMNVPWLGECDESPT